VSKVRKATNGIANLTRGGSLEHRSVFLPVGYSKACLGNRRGLLRSSGSGRHWIPVWNSIRRLLGTPGNYALVVLCGSYRDRRGDFWISARHARPRSIQALDLFLSCGRKPWFLDAMTDGGLGVAFFAPFDNHRYFFPWRPIRVSPIGAGRFFGKRGLAVLRSELLWIWIPAGILALAAWGFRRRRTTSGVQLKKVR